jgi:hypothetical protein
LDHVSKLQYADESDNGRGIDFDRRRTVVHALRAMSD